MDSVSTKEVGDSIPLTDSHGDSTMFLAQTIAALALSLNLSSATNPELGVEALQAPASTAEAAAVVSVAGAAGYSVVWYGWVDFYGVRYRTYSEYDFCGRLIRRWTVRVW